MKPIKPIHLKSSKPRDIMSRVWANRPKQQKFKHRAEPRGGAGSQEKSWESEYDDFDEWTT